MSLENTDVNNDLNILSGVDDVDTDSDSRVYELAFHLVPTLPEESVAVEFSNIKSLIEKAKGHFISEDFPKMRVLAYSISKKIKAANHTFDRAYFGWIKFEASPEVVEILKKQLDLSDVVLRYLTIKTVKENTLYTQRTYKGPVTKKPDDASSEVANEAVSPDKAVPSMSEAEIDKTIDSLVIN
ncbi:MAG: 30S ribosomal protein S6 [Candidatus Pacebacteria bacterium]|nr:30S ribosomal protein S6 [Candidatus Paceibacterota bacterium]